MTFPPPVSGFFRLTETGLGKSAKTHQSIEGLLWRHRPFKFSNRKWVKPVEMVPSGERLSALSDRIHPCRPRSKHPGSRSFGIKDSFEPPFPISHFVDFIKDNQIPIPAPALLTENLPIRNAIKV